MKPKRPVWIPVAAGVLRKENKVLIGKRPEHGTLPGLWEFPGGKIEVGESPEQALKRELEEELGIDAEVGDILESSSHHYGDKGIIILFFWVDYWKGEPKSLHHESLEWIELEELESRNIPDSNRDVIKKLKLRD
ncbi:MAG: 8-oxo-dGTP diphosphatase MutT [Bdellovibrionota bacterium]|nr:8-oxo-dGTP diphosphatase MutT [Pseudobdellovibrionaceae bacterium]|tara:strand:+ start:30964 stop:31368 length:405 start_codon:yes stop_codon:yes gene_type:complete